MATDKDEKEEANIVRDMLKEKFEKMSITSADPHLSLMLTGSGVWSTSQNGGISTPDDKSQKTASFMQITDQNDTNVSSDLRQSLLGDQTMMEEDDGSTLAPGSFIDQHKKDQEKDKTQTNKQKKKNLQRRASQLIPELKPKDLKLMIRDSQDENLREDSEQLTVEWIHAFMDEIYRIDNFFQSKQTELIDNFIALQDKFRLKTQRQQDEQDEVKGKESKSKAKIGKSDQNKE